MRWYSHGAADRCRGLRQTRLVFFEAIEKQSKQAEKVYISTVLLIDKSEVVQKNSIELFEGGDYKNV